MTEDYRALLKKSLEEREKVYQYVKGMINGQQMTNLSQTHKDMLKIIEAFSDFSKKTGDTLDKVSTLVLALEKRISTLESEIRKIRETLDTLYDNR